MGLALELSFMVFQGCFFRGEIGREQGKAGANERREDHWQEGSEGQGGFAGERNQGSEKVRFGWSTMQHSVGHVYFRLTHPNIVQLLETFEDKSKVYLVMELWVLFLVV